VLAVIDHVNTPMNAGCGRKGSAKPPSALRGSRRQFGAVGKESAFDDLIMVLGV
jgi:hypothetical protein